MSGLRAAVLATFCLTLFVENASAQLRGGANDRASERGNDRVGILGRVSARRDERLGRTPPAPNPPNPASNPNLAPNTRAPNPLNNGPAANSNNGAAVGRGAGAQQPNTAFNAQRSNPGNASLYNNRNDNSRNGVPTPAPQPRLNDTTASANSRGAYYGANANSNARASRGDSRDNRFPVPPAPVPEDDLGPNVRPASANAPVAVGQADNRAADKATSAPINRLPYRGPGVLIRLSRDLQGEVNYLVDDAEHLVIHSGQVQLLRVKGSYEVRFSRGVTSDGKSYGEARYTINEGIYRFDVSDNGWELYREGEARDVSAAVADIEKQALQEESALDRFKERDRETEPSSSNKNEEGFSSTPAMPTPAPSTSEETLPAPKSILEPT